jgi:hypothetical protein
MIEVCESTDCTEFDFPLCVWVLIEYPALAVHTLPADSRRLVAASSA